MTFARNTRCSGLGTVANLLDLGSPSHLIRPLGQWLPTEEQCRWFFDPSTERLYEKAGFEITYFPRAPGRPSRNALIKFHRSLGSPTPGIPASAERATVECTAHLLWLTGNSLSSALATSTSGQTLEDRLSRLVPATSWAVTHHVLITEEGSTITEIIREGRCVSVSDGSFKDQYGTSAWAIEADSNIDRCTGADIPPEAASKNNRCKGVNIVPDAPSDQSAYRSEVAGLFGIATMVRELCGFHDITAGTVYLGCDGLFALLNCTDIDYVIRAMLQQWPVKWIPHHVLRHQDDDPTLSLTAGRLSIWTKTLKCIGPKLLISLATVNLQSQENPGHFGCRTKISV
jgi:hypothetical protein